MEWLITDTHFNHDMLTKYCGRPPNFTELIIDNWKRMVKPEDTIYHLGDLGFYKKKELAHIIKDLPGTKILILGNHDRFPLAWYMDCGFLVMDTAVVRVKYTKGIDNPRNNYYKVLLSHEPKLIDTDLITCNVHGHFHNITSKRWEGELVNRLTMKHRLLSLEDQDYKPIKFGWALYNEVLPMTITKLSERYK